MNLLPGIGQWGDKDPAEWDDGESCWCAVNVKQDRLAVCVQERKRIAPGLAE